MKLRIRHPDITKIERQTAYKEEQGHVRSASLQLDRSSNSVELGRLVYLGKKHSTKIDCCLQIYFQLLISPFMTDGTACSP